MDTAGLWVGLVAILSFVTADDEYTWFEPVEVTHNAEYYDSGATRFAIYLTPVKWKEAHQLCPAKQGRLIEMQDVVTSEFIGRALAESAVGFGSLWIGGVYTPDREMGNEGVWSWNSGTVIDSKLENVDEFPMKVTPYWVDRPNVTSRQPMCLATDRLLHQLPLILGQPCDMKRPYICALPATNGENTTIEVGPPIKMEGKEFHIFRSESTWAEALSQCRAIGMSLAKVTSEMEFTMVNSRMLRSRPILENAWLSGTVTDDKWTWITDNEPINVDQTKANATHPFVWFRPDDIIMHGCLLADRHLCDHFVYLEAKCDRRRPYICEYVPPPLEEPPLKKVPGSDEYYVSTYVEIWEKAMNVCKVCLDGHLMQIDATEEGLAKQLPVLFNAMAVTLTEEVRHVWMGGYLYNDQFKWSKDRRTQPGDDMALNADDYTSIQSGGKRGTLYYCAVNFTRETYLRGFKCLNMDRENQKNFIMYGLQCHVKQHFICQADPAAELNPLCIMDHYLL